MSQFRNIDLRGPQKVRIIWTMETPDDDTSDRPDERDEGFWPNTDDKDSAGYVLPENFAEQQRIAKKRMAAFDRGDWSYVGVIARADVYIPIGDNSYAIHTFCSAGIWGIESDCIDYVEEQFSEQKEELLDSLKTLGAALASGDFIDQTDGKSAVQVEA